MVETAKRYGFLEHRSVPRQVEYWIRRPSRSSQKTHDLPFSVIRDILIADQDAPAGEYPCLVDMPDTEALERILDKDRGLAEAFEDGAV